MMSDMSWEEAAELLLSPDDTTAPPTRRSERKEVRITAAGSSRYSQGKGGWAAILRYNQHRRVIEGCGDSNSEYRMQIMAAVQAMKCLKEPCAVTLATAGDYLNDNATRLLRPSRSDAWVGYVHRQTANNSDLWLALEAASRIHRVRLEWIPFKTKNGDAKDADRVARQAARRQ